MSAEKIDPILEEEEVEDNETARQQAINNTKFNFKRSFKNLWEFLTYENIKDLTRWFLESAAIEFSFSFDDLMMSMTLFVLFGNEVRILAVDKQHDTGFVVMTTICFAAFIVELVLVTWSKTYHYSFKPWECEGYFLSFFFVLDVLAILSMFPEVPAISEAFGFDSLYEDHDNQTTLKTARVVRMVRLVRLVKIYKIQAERRRAARLEAELLDLVRQGAVSYDDIATQRALYQSRQSKVGGLLSDSITRRVITIVLCMLFVVPFLQLVILNEERNTAVGSLLHFVELDEPNDLQTKLRFAAMDTFRKHAPNLVRVEITQTSNLERADHMNFDYTQGWANVIGADPATDYSSFWENTDVVEKRRTGSTPKELDTIVMTGEKYQVSATFDLWFEEYDRNVNQILLIIFVSIMLVAGSVVFTNDAQRLVLDPIERMMNMVEAVSKDPLQPLQFQHGSGQGEYETMLLESTIEKITSLLRVGFGEAGAGIIKANLDIADNSSVINPLIPGVRIYAVFGFCDIHHFDDVNQHMGQDVLTFVNTIAEIVHSSVHDWGGQSNKNLGNAFLMIWRIGDEKTILKLTSGGKEAGMSLKDLINPNKKPLKKRPEKVVDLRRVPGIDRLADKALIGYLKIIAELNRSKPILDYRNDARLTVDGPFKVRMGFGLHAGWAIEGAVGSIQKVDATYLSPHVNMSARLETSSKQFGVPLLFSQTLFDLLSPEVQDVCRKLDVVTVKGSEHPIAVFTYDARQDQKFRPVPVRMHKSISFAANKAAQSSEAATAKGKKPYGGQVAPVDAPKGKEVAKQRLSITAVATKPANHSNEHHDFAYYQAHGDADLQFMTPENDTSDVMELDVDLVYLRRHVSAEFVERHKHAVNLYLQGDWTSATTEFNWCDKWMATNAEGFDGDGPSRVILNYMNNRNNTAPADWKGYRPLTSK